MDYIYIVTKDTFEVKLIKRDEIKSFPNTIRQFLNLTEAYEFVSKESRCRKKPVLKGKGFQKPSLPKHKHHVGQKPYTKT